MSDSSYLSQQNGSPTIEEHLMNGRNLMNGGAQPSPSVPHQLSSPSPNVFVTNRFPLPTSSSSSSSSSASKLSPYNQPQPPLPSHGLHLATPSTLSTSPSLSPPLFDDRPRTGTPQLGNLGSPSSLSGVNFRPGTMLPPTLSNSVQGN